MKNILIAIIAIFLAPQISLAAITFSPTEPQDSLSYVVPTCDTGDVFQQFDAAGNYWNYRPCDGIENFASSGGASIDIIAECDSALTTSPFGNCSWSTITLMRLDPGYISEYTYEFTYTPPPDETCEDGIQNQDETGIDTGGVCTVPLISLTTEWAIQFFVLLITFALTFYTFFFIVKKSL